MQKKAVSLRLRRNGRTFDAAVTSEGFHVWDPALNEQTEQTETETGTGTERKTETEMEMVTEIGTETEMQTETEM